KGGKGLGKGGLKAPQEGSTRQHPGYHQARDPPAGSSWRCKAHLWPYLRGNARCAQGILGERHPRLGDLHRARSPEDCNGNGCGIRS
ncbi:unnamed protein product, partial [Ascophyllum nodosum]